MILTSKILFTRNDDMWISIYAICAEFDFDFRSSHSHVVFVRYNRFFCVSFFFSFVIKKKKKKKKIKCVIYINVDQHCDSHVENFIYTKRWYVNFDLCDMCWIRFWFSLVTRARRFWIKKIRCLLFFVMRKKKKK